VRYLTFAEVLVLAEGVTGIDVNVIANFPNIGLLDSALTAPSAGFGEVDTYPDFHQKVSALCFHIAKNHALTDGNKRVAWISAVQFAWMNGFELLGESDEVVETMFNLAGDTLSQKELDSWMLAHLTKKAKSIPI
jgi:death-on-curing protein